MEGERLNRGVKMEAGSAYLPLLLDRGQNGTALHRQCVTL